MLPRSPVLSILVETEVGLVIGVDARRGGNEKRGREEESSMVLSVYATAFSLYLLGWLPYFRLLAARGAVKHVAVRQSMKSTEQRLESCAGLLGETLWLPKLTRVYPLGAAKPVPHARQPACQHACGLKPANGSVV
jgi:hypothetical protein